MNSNQRENLRGEDGTWRSIIFSIFIVLFIIIPVIKWIFLGNIPEDIKSLESEVSELHSDVEELTSATNSFSSEISALKIEVSSLRSEINSLKLEN